MRQIADVLGVTAGVLADGILPPSFQPLTLSRENLDNAAGCLAGEKDLKDLTKAEAEAVRLMEPLVGARTSGSTGRNRGARAYLAAKTRLGREQIDSLVSRLDKKRSVRRGREAA